MFIVLKMKHIIWTAVIVLIMAAFLIWMFAVPV
jgi:hypothetical protein